MNQNELSEGHAATTTPILKIKRDSCIKSAHFLESKATECYHSGTALTERGTNRSTELAEDSK